MIKSQFLIALLAISAYSYYGLKKNHSDYTRINNVARPNFTTPEENYANYCAGCHGEKMDAFTDRRWKHGNKLPDLIKAIKMGYPDEGMPAFRKTFTDAEITQLSEYILKGIKNVEAYDFDSAPVSDVFKSDNLTVKLEPVATGINVPWSIAFLQGNALLVTNRDGELYYVKDTKKVAVNGVPKVLAEGQGGLMDVVLHPEFKKNSLLYISYSKPKTVDGKILATTAVMRATLDGYNLKDQKIIFEALPYSSTRHHYGSRLVFDAGGYLFISVGERGNEKQNPQTIENNQLGKIHRINDDGTIPKDNPFKDKTAKPTTLYTYGNRNPQGMAINPTTGALWANEHGPRGGDEINIVKPGSNYGWPIASYGINYDGNIITNKTTMQGVQEPELYWIPSIAPSGMAFVTGDVYKPWKGAALIGSLRFNYLNLCYLDGNKVVSQEKLLKNIGRVRDVRVSPDGYIYVAVEKPAAAVYRLVPVK